LSENGQSRIPRPPFGRIVARAFASPTNILVGGAGAVAAVAVGFWPLAALGGVAYLGLVAWDVASPDFWSKVLGDPALALPEQNVELPSPKKLADPVLRTHAEGVARAREELLRLVQESQGSVSSELVGITVPLAELEGRAARLLRMGDGLYRYLASVNVDALRREASRLRSHAELSSDPAAREQYAATAAAREKQLEVIDDLARALDRVHASLARIVATLEGLAAQVVRVGALDAETMQGLSGDVDAELKRVSTEVGTLEETIRQFAGAEVAAR
jgi:hypothetical protein